MIQDPISLFVAMPYTDLGPNAKWKKVPAVERFYEQVRRTVEAKMGRPANLHIEKYAPRSGLVMDSMFQAIHTADVFIADLTGTNANVFLELGIRYGLSQKVTILTTQEDQAPPFDLNQMRLVRYANGPTDEAAEAIADIVFEELGTQKANSPVLSMLDLQVVPKREWEIVAGERIDLLIGAARKESDPQRRLDLVLEAVAIDPLSLTARVELVRLYRARQEFDIALIAIADAIRLFPRSPLLHKERGLVLDRGGDRLDEAMEEYRIALQLDDQDADLHCCYGGALRRKGLSSAGEGRTRYLQESLSHYNTSLSLERHSTYAGLNVLRLMVLMTADEGGPLAKIDAYLQRMYHLCSFEVTDSQIKAEDGQWWRMFDLADVLALMNERDQALHVYKEAIEIIPVPQRVDTLVSPARSWQELLTAGSLDKKLTANGEDILRLLDDRVALSN
jgi:tetratricopeptide (TPR) repeat protein